MSGTGARPRGALLLAAIFVLGFLCGAAGTLLTVRRVVARRLEPGGAGGMIFQRLSRDLDLDAAQRVEVEAALKDARAKLVAIADRSEPEVRAVLQSARERIRAVLRPDQRGKFDREIERRLDRYRRFRLRMVQGGRD